MRSRIFAAPGEEMLGKAIALTLHAAPRERADLFERLVGEIVVIVAAADSGMRPWTCSVHPGLDGSRVFRGGAGQSLVIDPQGRPVARKPHYDQMREYIVRRAADADRSRRSDQTAIISSS